MRSINLIRPVNLIIISLAQYVVHKVLLTSALVENEIQPLLSGSYLLLFISVTVILAASSYIINDIYDSELDLVNKPNNTFVGKTISKGIALLLYYSLVIIGLIIATYLAYNLNRMPLLIIYPFAVVTLHLYSSNFKKSLLIGNIIVSVFCAFVIGIVWIGESEGITHLTLKSESYRSLRLLFWGMVIFAFVSNLIRELIKDVEDMEGDGQHGGRTFPVVYGFSQALKLIKTLLFFLGILIVIWSISLYTVVGNSTSLIIGSILLLIGTYIFRLINRSTAAQELRKTSQLMKIFMIIGLLYPLVI